MHVCELSHKLKVSADLQVGWISKYAEVTEASEALVSTMAYHTAHKQYDQDTDLSYPSPPGMKKLDFRSR